MNQVALELEPRNEADANRRRFERVVRAQFRRAKNNLLTAVAVIRDAERGDKITSNQIRRYCDEAIRAIEEVESLRSNDRTEPRNPKTS